MKKKIIYEIKGLYRDSFRIHYSIVSYSQLTEDGDTVIGLSSGRGSDR